MHPYNIEARKLFGTRHGFKVCIGAHYLGDYIRDDDYKRNWLAERTLMWEKNFCTIRKTAGKYTQESYAAVVHAIQSSWIFIQHVITYMGELFAGVEKMIR